MLDSTLNLNLLADRVRIANYAIKFDQMYRVMDGYKRNRPESMRITARR